jgi:hypothetical protein
MNYRLLVTTFTNDIPQFKMFCYCLNKNWKGNKNLIVCLDTNDVVDTFRNITNEIFSKQWNIEICPTVYPYNNGTCTNQVNVIYQTSIATVEDIIAWDCKNFLLKPADFLVFKHNNRYRIPHVDSTKRLVDLGYQNLSRLVDQPIDHYPAMSNLRPNIFNVAQTSRYWQALNERFGHYSTWKEYPVGCEYYGYFIFAMQDPQRTIKFMLNSWQSFLIAGGWTHQTYDGMVQQVQEFAADPGHIIWMHSRKLADPRCLDVTRSVLIKYGINKSFVDQVYG